MQEANFDRPGIFRPVIINAGLAFSYTVEYTMRLFNRNDGHEIIKRSTFTSYEPKKYGKQLERINVINGYRPFKVYNKIETIGDSGVGASSYANNVVPQPVISTVYVNTFIDSTYISVDSTNDVSQKLGQTVYSQGKNYIFMNPFDNFFKFKIFTKSADKQEDISLDLSTSYNRLNIVFIQDDGTKIYTPALKDNTLAPASGECLFKIDDTLSTLLLTQTNKEYYLVVKTPDGDDSLIYSGNFSSQGDRMKVQAEINNTISDNLSQQIADLESAKAALDSKNADLEAQTKTLADQQATLLAEQNILLNTNQNLSSTSAQTASLNSELQKQLDEISTANAFLTKQQQSLQEALNAAATGRSNNFNFVEIPGVSTSLGIGLKNATQPIVQNPANPNANPEFTKPVTGTGGQQIKTVGT